MGWLGNALSFGEAALTGSGVGMLGAVGGLALGQILTTKEKKEVLPDFNVPTIIDSTGRVPYVYPDKTVPDYDADGRFYNGETKAAPGTSYSTDAKPPYYIVYPPTWKYDPSGDKVIFDKDGLPKIQFGKSVPKDWATKDYYANYNLASESSVYPISDDGSIQFNKNLTKVKPMALDTTKTPDNTNTAVSNDNTNTAVSSGGQASSPGGSSLPASNSYSGETAGLPSQFNPAYDQYVADTNKATTDYEAKNKMLWDFYLQFEKNIIDKTQTNMDDMNTKINNLPKMSLKMPDSMGGSTTDMVPTKHINAIEKQATTTQNLIDSLNTNTYNAVQGAETLANKNAGMAQAQAANNLLPAQLAEQLYAAQQGYDANMDQIKANKPDKPSPWSTWAPVAEQFVKPGNNGQSILGEGIDKISNLFSNNATTTDNVMSGINGASSVWSGSNYDGAFDF